MDLKDKIDSMTTEQLIDAAYCEETDPQDQVAFWLAITERRFRENGNTAAADYYAETLQRHYEYRDVEIVLKTYA